MKYRIIKKKLIFLHHVETLPDGSLAKEVLDIQKKLKLPGLAQECQEWLVKFDIYRLDDFTKQQWKRLIKKKISEINKDDILSQIASYKKLKLEDYKDEEYKVQSYLNTLNIANARTKFKFKSFMLPTIKMSFPSDPNFARELWRFEGVFH